MGRFKHYIDDAESYLIKYLSFFGGRKFQIMELTPFDDVDPRPHIRLMTYRAEMQARIDSGGEMSETDNEKITEMESYSHICWCNPELIYCDDTRGNEVWKHHYPN